MRLIDADAFIEHLKKTAEVNNDRFSELEKGLTFLADAYATFKEVDAVEVIRCKECKYCMIFSVYKTKWYVCTRNVESIDVEAEDFCSNAERGNNETD